MKTEYSHEFQESRTRDNHALVNSVLQALSPVYSLLNSVVYWSSQHWHWSRIQYFTNSFLHCVTHYGVLQLQSPLTLFHTPCSAVCNTLSHHDTTACSPAAERWSHMPLMCFSNIQLCPNQFSGSVWHSVSFCQRHWHTSSLDTRGFAGCHSTKHCCRLLQYNKYNVQHK